MIRSLNFTIQTNNSCWSLLQYQHFNTIYSIMIRSLNFPTYSLICFFSIFDAGDIFPPMPAPLDLTLSIPNVYGIGSLLNARTALSWRKQQTTKALETLLLQCKQTRPCCHSCRKSFVLSSALSPNPFISDHDIVVFAGRVQRAAEQRVAQGAKQSCVTRC